MSDDFPTLRPITTRPVALNLAAWDIECLPDPLDSEHVAMEIARHLFSLPDSQSEDAMSEPLEYRTEHHTQCLYCSGPLTKISDATWRCDFCRLLLSARQLLVYEPGEWKRQEEKHAEARRRLYEQSAEDSLWEEDVMSEPTSHPVHWIPYRGYWITYDPPPIPTWKQHAWQYWHDEYDGAPDAHDSRRGSASSLEEAKREIDEQTAERLAKSET